MRLPPFPLFQRTFVRVILNICTIRFDGSVTTSFNVLLTIPPRETPLLRGEDLLATWELELGPPQGLQCSSFVVVFASDRHQWLSDVDTCNRTLWFPVSSSHAGLQSVCSCTRQHFVDANDVEGVDPHADVEGVLASDLGHVFVGTDASSFECFGRQLFVFVRHQVHTFGEFVHSCLLLTQIEDSDLRVRDTTAEAGLGVGFVFAVTIATSRTTTHGGCVVGLCVEVGVVYLTQQFNVLNISDYM